MNPNSLAVRYRHLFPELERLSRAENVIKEENVFQPANQEIKTLIASMCSDNMLPTSEFRNMNYAKTFLESIKAGKRGIILMEHYSNFDLPGILYLLEKEGSEGKELASRIVAIAGKKAERRKPLCICFSRSI